MIDRALELGTNRSLATIMIAARTRKAQNLLALGKKKEALGVIQSAVPQIETCKLLVVDPSEVYFTHYQVLKALGN
jgi:tRNA1(Val) A37 N6-methylase TrmN6